MQMTQDALTARWAEISEKLVALAEEFPERAYDWRPVAEVRSYAEQLRHIAFWNFYLRNTLRGEAADGEANELPRDQHPDKPRIVAVLRESVDAVMAELSSNGSATPANAVEPLATFVQHNAEHYGQLVVYHRLQGLVPPASTAG